MAFSKRRRKNHPVAAPKQIYVYLLPSDSSRLLSCQCCSLSERSLLMTVREKPFTIVYGSSMLSARPALLGPKLSKFWSANSWVCDYMRLSNLIGPATSQLCDTIDEWYISSFGRFSKGVETNGFLARHSWKLAIPSFDHPENTLSFGSISRLSWVPMSTAGTALHHFHPIRPMSGWLVRLCRKVCRHARCETSCSRTYLRGVSGKLRWNKRQSIIAINSDLQSPVWAAPQTKKWTWGANGNLISQVP